MQYRNNVIIFFFKRVLGLKMLGISRGEGAKICDYI